jgi:glycosyl transferase family 25
MNAYIINMPSAVERKRHLEKLFVPLKTKAIFIDAVVGSDITLPDPKYNESLYRKAHGKRTNLSELGCYFSHLKALTAFLKDDNEHALILEDDIDFDSSLETVIFEVLKHNKRFDLLRLSGLHDGNPIKIIKLTSGYKLCCNYTIQTGAGAYLVNKYAASRMLKALTPMWLPFDHAFDREWLWGVKSMCLDPMPVKQNIGFPTQINSTKELKLPFFKRYITVFPFRFYNEVSRIIFRTLSILKQKIISY